MSKRRYNNIYMLTHDIDWFASCNGRKIHIASNGCLIDNYITVSENRAIQSFIYDTLAQTSRRDINDTVYINESVIRHILQEFYGYNEVSYEDVQNYASSFVKMASLGFISLDTINGEYYLIAKPNEGHIELRDNHDVIYPQVERIIFYEEFGDNTVIHIL